MVAMIVSNVDFIVPPILTLPLFNR
jgi:hypothetical protein